MERRVRGEFKGAHQSQNVHVLMSVVEKNIPDRSGWREGSDVSLKGPVSQNVVVLKSVRMSWCWRVSKCPGVEECQNVLVLKSVRMSWCWTLKSLIKMDKEEGQRWVESDRSWWRRRSEVSLQGPVRVRMPWCWRASLGHIKGPSLTDVGEEQTVQFGV